MRDRAVPREKIVEEIAQRAVYSTNGVNEGTSLVTEMSGHARKLLKQERYREAAAVLEFGAQHRPKDPEVQNNFGFCLIPVDSRKALEHLKAAANMGYQPSATNSYNQMCCYVSIGRPRAALNIADSETRKSSPGHRSATLWRIVGEGKWELFDSDDSLESVAIFAVEIARNEGWNEEKEAWEKVVKHQKLTSGRNSKSATISDSSDV
jgi:hypothetical protein